MAGWAQNKSTFIDPRDSKVYQTVEIDSVFWMAENLSFKMLGSYDYEDKRAYSEVYGKLYEWPIALVACPAGWHLPDADEWNKLTEYHCLYFNSIPSGNRDPIGNYSNLEEYSYYWTAIEGDSLTAVRKIIAKNGLSFGGGYGNKTSAYNVRCVRDKE
jgi:hypothetical protein